MLILFDAYGCFFAAPDVSFDRATGWAQIHRLDGSADGYPMAFQFSEVTTGPVVSVWHAGFVQAFLRADDRSLSGMNSDLLCDNQFCWLL